MPSRPRYYPAFIDLTERKCVVVGGGNIAERKVRSLVAAGARVRVISPDITSGLQKLSQDGRITHTSRKFTDRDLDGAFLAVAATDNEADNLRVARRRDMLINVVDRPELCTFIVPSSFTRGPLSVAISTSGASPALAREIRKDMEARYGSAFGVYLKKVSRLRARAMQAILEPAARMRFLNALAGPGIIRKLLKGVQPDLPKLPASKKTGRK